jgi:hypothetical protein
MASYRAEHRGRGSAARATAMVENASWFSGFAAKSLSYFQLSMAQPAGPRVRLG